MTIVPFDGLWKIKPWMVGAEGFERSAPIYELAVSIL